MVRGDIGGELISTKVGELSVQRVGSGPAVLFWHSMMVDRTQWSRITADLAADHLLILIDGPGHGHSGIPPEHYTLDDCADAAATVLDALGIDSVDWVGNAWGGHVGLVFADRYPDRCRSLVAIGTPTVPLARKERVETRVLAMLYRRLGASKLLRNAICDTLVSRGSRKADPQARQLVADGFARADRTGMHRSILAMMLHRPDLGSRLAGITVPTVVMTGRSDKLWPPTLAELSAAELPHGSCVVIEDASRLPPLERPAEVLSQLRAFWARTGLTPASPEPATLSATVPASDQHA